MKPSSYLKFLKYSEPAVFWIWFFFFQIPRPGDSFDFEIVSNIWNKRLADSEFFDTRNWWVLQKSITHPTLVFFYNGTSSGAAGSPEAWSWHSSQVLQIQLKNHPIIPIPQKSLKVLKPLANSIKRKHPIKGRGKSQGRAKRPKRHRPQKEVRESLSTETSTSGGLKHIN